jgi:ubiquinol-cytochrome c reductase cytochrome c1 subunit
MRITLAFIVLMLTSFAQAASLEINIHDKEKLQRGAKFFMNYCSGCHSLEYMRYNTMAMDLGLTSFDGKVDSDLLTNNLIFTKSTIYDPIKISMPPEDARQWFGIVPPDLSLISRVRGASWLYNYFRGFYADPSRSFGTNNILFPQVAMPNVFAPLVGIMIASPHAQLESPEDLRLAIPGKISEPELDSHLEDLITFLVYVGEPARLVRYKLGIFVIVFLIVFFLFANALKNWYWRRLKSSDKFSRSQT